MTANLERDPRPAGRRDKGPRVKEVLSLNAIRLSDVFGLPDAWTDIERLESEGWLIDAVNRTIATNAIFRRRRFDSIFQFSVYRNLVYYLVRALRPRRVIETGVLHGLTSAWILKALEDNGAGTLTSIDLPRADWDRHFGGTSYGPGAEGEELPPGIGSGWIVPDALRHRWDLRLGPSQLHLGPALADGPVDLFIHDSDHSYETMAYECRTVLAVAPETMMVVDDFNLNAFAFEQLARHPSTFMFMDEVDDDLRLSQCTVFVRATGEGAGAPGMGTTSAGTDGRY